MFRSRRETRVPAEKGERKKIKRNKKKKGMERKKRKDLKLRKVREDFTNIFSKDFLLWAIGWGFRIGPNLLPNPKTQAY